MIRLNIRSGHSRWLCAVMLGALTLAGCAGAGASPTSYSTNTRLEPPEDVRLVAQTDPQGTPVPTPTANPFGPIGGVTPAADTTQPTLSPTPLPALRADLMGVQIYTGVSDADLELTLFYSDQLGVDWLKMQFSWDVLEPEPGVLSETFYRYRIFLQRAQTLGYKIMVSVAKAPDWARATADEDGPPVDPAALASFLSRMLSEIGVDVYENSYISALEVWNEPNLRREWNGGALNGADYMRYFNAAYTAIRSAQGTGNTVIVTAGLAPTGVNDGVTATDDREYLRQMYRAGLGDPAYQNIAIGVHPYAAWNAPDARCCAPSGQGWDISRDFFFLDTLEDYRAIMEQAGDAGRQLWATEFGWATFDGLVLSDGSPAPPPADKPYFAYINAEQMGNYIIRAYEIGQSLPYLGPMILWNLNFAGTRYVEEQNAQAGYAILGNAEDPRRPAFFLIGAAPKITPQP